MSVNYSKQARRHFRRREGGAMAYHGPF